MVPVPPEVLHAFLDTYQIDIDALDGKNAQRAGGDGAVYEYGPAAERRFLKILAVPADHPDGCERIRSRLNFAHFMAEHRVPMVYPLPSPNGRLFETSLSGNHTFVAYIMDKAPGRIVHPREWTGAQYRALGKILGRMHRLTQQYPQWLHPIRPTAATADGPLGWQEEWQAFYNWCKDADVQERWVRIRERLEQLPVDRASFGYIHNDPHPYNILVEGNSIVILDFDVANCHWFATDIAIALQGVLFSRSGGLDRPVADVAPIRDFLTHFRFGYEEEYQLSADWWQRLDLFISYRRILLFTCFYEELQKRPAALATWKQAIMAEPRVTAEMLLEGDRL